MTSKSTFGNTGIAAAVLASSARLRAAFSDGSRPRVSLAPSATRCAGNCCCATLARTSRLPTCMGGSTCSAGIAASGSTATGTAVTVQFLSMALLIGTGGLYGSGAEAACVFNVCHTCAFACASWSPPNLLSGESPRATAVVSSISSAERRKSCLLGKVLHRV
eukprot:scaffold93708_cov72-Phaeocystis_antarctica.AAC.5